MRINRRDVFKLGGAFVLGSAAALRPGKITAQTVACSGLSPIEAFPTSPLILPPGTSPTTPADQLVNPFSDANLLVVPTPLQPDPTVQILPGAVNDSDGVLHQLLPSALGLPNPVGYRIRLQVSTHSFTPATVRQLVNGGIPDPLTGAYPLPAGMQSALPLSTIYGFNGTFPGPMIYGAYGQPYLVRFENHLDENPMNLDRQDFGAPDWAFLTHLHNGHTEPESDGNPNHKPGAYQPGGWVQNLYLNWPAGGDDTEKQSFFWFHDHRMDHTGANVYKGMVGLYPIYDPRMDSGDERKGFRLPGVPTGFTATGDVDYTKQILYDIPMALYDCGLDDGATPHQDFHNGCGEIHPEWWGKTYFRHFPNHGFVGDVFTVNGSAFPTLYVKRRRYRLRFLDASISRIYKLMLTNGNNGTVAKAFPGQKGQYNLGHFDSSGNFVRGAQQCMQFTQVATDGGLIPFAVTRDSFDIWPAKRKEFVVDFSKYMDGSPTTTGDVIYLTNVLPMDTGRKPNDGLTTTEPDGTTFVSPPPDPTYAVPILRIVIDGSAVDNSVAITKNTQFRNLPQIPNIGKMLANPADRTFEFQRSGTFGGETQWLVNQRPFDPTNNLAFITKGAAEVWDIRNGGGGWVHPVHLHYEEHHTLSRNGVPTPDASHPDDNSKEDVIGLLGSETVRIFRRFRDFTGKYVVHCHNLAHEDHAMMFGFTVLP